MLDQLGVWAALDWHAEEVCARAGLICHVRLHPETVLLEIDPERSTALFRILQEALTNVVRHAGATRVDVRVSHAYSSIRLEVEDDGRGMDCESLLTANSWGWRACASAPIILVAISDYGGGRAWHLAGLGSCRYGGRMRSGKIRVLLVDDHVVARNGIRLMLGTDDGIEVVAEADTARAALYLLQSQQFDLAIVDIGLPDQNGLQLLKQFRREQPRLAVLMLSMYAETVYAVRALQYGAAGYLTKNCNASVLLGAVHKAASGGCHQLGSDGRSRRHDQWQQDGLARETLGPRAGSPAPACRRRRPG